MSFSPSLIARLLGTAVALVAPLAATTPASAVAPAAVEAIHAAALPFDAHADIPDNFDPAKADQRGQGQFDLAAAAQGGLRGAALAIFAPQEGDSAELLAKARAIAESKHVIITGIAKAFPAKAAIALTPADYRRITASGRFALVESVVNGGAFVGSAEDVDLWAKRGVRIFGFVHAGHNALADSSRPALARGEGLARHGGLSAQGKAVLARLNDDGILVDISQLSDAGFDDVLRLSKAPVIASHSDLRALVPNGRNLTDAQLDAIKAKGGVVAVNAFSAYLRPRDPAFAQKLEALKTEYGIDGPDGAKLPPEKAADYDRAYHALRATEPRASVVDLVNAVDHVVKRIGIDHVTLSSDFNHGGGIAGWDHEGESRAVTEELVKRGYKSAEIAKIWSGNVLRVWAQAQSLAKAQAASKTKTQRRKP
jgi:membrane dipeptidase